MIQLTRNVLIVLAFGAIIAIVAAGYPYFAGEAGVYQTCEIENCHGLDITCGSNPPDACTEEYRLGDYCRALAKCEIVEDECVFNPSYAFTQCKDCVENCNRMSGSDAFVCEDLCRETYPA